MQQRMSIAQAVICKPKILLLDEPFGALDPGVTADMHELILKLWAENRMTIFMVSHDIQESFPLGTRLLTFDKVRHDPQAPEAYGARVTYDMRLERRKSQVSRGDWLIADHIWRGGSARSNAPGNAWLRPLCALQRPAGGPDLLPVWYRSHGLNKSFLRVGENPPS